MGGNFREKLEESPRIKFRGLNFVLLVMLLPSTLKKGPFRHLRVHLVFVVSQSPHAFVYSVLIFYGCLLCQFY